MQVDRTKPKIMGRLDVAKFLNVSQQYVSKLIQEEKIPFQKTSAGIVFLESDVSEYRRERLQRAKSDTRIRVKKRRA